MKPACTFPGCPRPAAVRRMCKSHYTANYKRRRYLLGKDSVRVPSVGVSRRLRALVAMGYPMAYLSRQLGIHQSYISKLAVGYRNTCNPDTAAKVAALYDRISMTPGPSQAARDKAHRQGWMPPLAWDDDEIDDWLAVPHPGEQERIGFRERFLEMRELGYSDLIIAQRWNIQPASLLRQLNRHDIPPDEALVTQAASTKYRRRAEAAS